jgi:hypothetical protein
MSRIIVHTNSPWLFVERGHEQLKGLKVGDKVALSRKDGTHCEDLLEDGIGELAEVGARLRVVDWPTLWPGRGLFFLWKLEPLTPGQPSVMLPSTG